MSATELKRLARDCAADPALRERLSAADAVHQAADIARAVGYDIGREELGAYLARPGPAELSGTQLDAVAGGRGFGPGGRKP
jgi:predicted ribosomally synthesized peptide with nif11-like leader